MLFIENMLQVLNACDVDKSVAMDQEMHFEPSEIQQSWEHVSLSAALDQPEVDVENQHHGEDIDRSQRITCSKF